MAKQSQEINLQISSKIFNPVYIPYLPYTAPLEIFYGGSSSGKSVFLADRCVLDVLSGGHNYLVIRKVASTVQRSVYNEVCKSIAKFKVTHLFKFNATDKIITCVTGYQIIFMGMDDPEKVKSITPAQGVITDIWYEEATESDYADVQQLDKRLRGRASVKKRIVLSFNPINQTHWIYQEYFKKVWQDDATVYKDTDILILKTTYKNNKFLTADDITRLEKTKDKYYRDVYLDGKWGVLGGAIFKNWTVRDLTEEKKNFETFKNGGDFGFSDDPATCIRSHYDRKNGKLYILEEFYEHGMTNQELAKGIKPIVGHDVVTFDCADPKSIAELNIRGIIAIPCTKSKDSVRFGIQWLQQQEIIIDSSCFHTKQEFQSYKWKEDKYGNTLPEPVDRNNHCIDALRYSCEDEMHRLYEPPAKGKSRRSIWDDEPTGNKWMLM